MKAVSVSPVKFNPDGTRVVDAFIVADTTPYPLPVNGENVDGMSEKDTFAPFSVLYIVGNASNKVFIADEKGQCVAQ